MNTSVRLLQAIVAAAAARGVPPERLLAAAGLRREELADPDGRVPRACELRLWDAVRASTGDESFGLHMAESLPVEAYGAMGFATRSSATLGEAYRRIARFVRLMRSGVRLEIVEDGAVVRLRHLPPAGEAPPSRHAVEWFMATLVLAARRGVEPGCVPLEARFSHAAPPRVDEHRRVFGAALRFAADRDELALPAALLARPQVGAEPGLSSMLDRHLDEALARLPAGHGVIDRVRAGVVEALRRGHEPTLAQLALETRMSARSLQRRLQQEGTSLQALLEQIRAELAARYLADGGYSISEVAFLLGFSEVSTFHRAFKRWTGATPAAFRRARTVPRAAGPHP
jgi:AraC-like DNA-binding protein